MKNIFLFLFLFMSFYSFAQTYPVGTQTITYTDAARANRPVGVEFRYPGTNAAVATGQFPFVIFAHGFQMDQVPYYPYADSLARQGYIVGLLTTETSLSPSHANFAQDLIFVHDKLISESNANAASPFYQKVIPKGALGGHSMGGGSTVLSGQYGNPATCYFTFAAAVTNPSSVTAAPSMSKPYLSFAGSRDCIAPIATHQQLMYDASGSPCKFLINITDALHCQFGNGNLQCNFGEGFSFCAASPLSRADQINKTLHFLVPYLNYYLKGDCSAWTLFETRYASNTADVMQRSCTNVVPSNPSIAGSDYFCNGSSTTLTAQPPSFTYLWNDNSTADTLSVAAAGNYSVEVGNGVCSLPAVSVSVEENFLPLLGTIDGVDTVCLNNSGTLNFSLSSVTDADSLFWSVSNPWSIISGQGTPVLSVNSYSASGTVSVYAGNECGTTPTLSLAVLYVDTPQITITGQGGVLSASAADAAQYQWYEGGVLVSGATNADYSPTASGNYTVIVTNQNGCSSQSVPFSFILSALAEVSGESFFSIYPNPESTGSLMLDVSKDWIGAEMKIFDLQGRMVLKSEIVIQKSAVPVSMSGVYVVRIEKEGRALVSVVGGNYR